MMLYRYIGVSVQCLSFVYLFGVARDRQSAVAKIIEVALATATTVAWISSKQ